MRRSEEGVRYPGAEVSHHVGARNRTGFLAAVTNAVNCRANSPSPLLFVFKPLLCIVLKAPT